MALRLRLAAIGPLLATLSLLTNTAQLAAAQQANGDAVYTEIRTRWAKTPAEAEAAEAIAAQSGLDATQPYFWRFVSWTEAHPYAGQRHGSGISEENWYAALMGGAARTFKYNQASAVALGLLEVSLANREFSPRVEMVRQVAASAWRAAEPGASGAPMPCAWVALGSGATVSWPGGAIGDPNENLQAALDAEPPATTAAFDSRIEGEHIHPGSWASLGRTPAIPTVTLYGQLFTEDLQLWLEDLAPRCEAGEIVLLLRLVDTGCGQFWRGGDSEDTVSVLGYGVELAVKDSEYKATDDQKAAKLPAGGGSASEWGEERRA